MLSARCDGPFSWPGFALATIGGKPCSQTEHTPSTASRPAFLGHDLSVLTRNWWLLLVRGIVSVIFGVLAFVWPGITLLALTLLYGAYAFLDGALCLTAAVTGSNDKSTSTGWLLFVGILGVAVGV